MYWIVEVMRPAVCGPAAAVVGPAAAVVRPAAVVVRPAAVVGPAGAAAELSKLLRQPGCFCLP